MNKQLKNVLLLTFIFLIPNFAIAEQVASLFSAQGTVEAKSANSNSWKAVVKGDKFETHHTVRTLANSRAGLLLTDGTLIRLNENSLLSFKDITQQGDERELELVSGEAFFFSRKPKRFPKIDTSNVSAAVRGTEFVVRTDSSTTSITVLEGSVEASNQHGQVQLKSGELALTKNGQAPTKQLVANPTDAVQWALNYPAVVSLSDFPGLTSSSSAKQKEGISLLNARDLKKAKQAFDDSSWQSQMGRSFTAYIQGDTQSAFAELSEQNLNADTLLYAASLNLSVGNVDKANALLEKALQQIDKSNKTQAGALSANYFAQKAIIALVSGDKELARQLAEKSRSANGSSSAALVASSYVAQGYFELEHAKNYIEKLLETDPQNEFALSRLAELQLAFGEIDQALESAQKAYQINPYNNISQNTLGFAYLVKYKAKEALSAFSEALKTNDTNGLTFLGMGLATIRTGDLESGRKLLEEAVIIEPNISLYRSYLGKAFFEEDKSELASREYNRAINLDQKDPTPYLYRAYDHLANNRVVDALKDTEKSIELNDNRAVFRSRLLLDQDAAVRSAGLAEVFNSLGFNRVAVIEAIKSINKDYGNYSAHRFLSDSYNTILLNDASLSERSIANLIAPLSFNLFNNPGTEASVNEFNSLFERPEDRTNLAFTASSLDDRLIPEIFHAGRTEKFGYFFGFESAAADGSKDNNYSRDYRFRASGQYQPTYEDRFIVEGRYKHQTRINSNAEIDDTKFEVWEGELGYSRVLSPTSKVIAQATFRDTRDHLGGDDSRIVDLDLVKFGDTFETGETLFLREFAREDVRDTRLSLQYYNSTEIASIVFGGEAYFAKPHRREISTIKDDDFSVFTDLNRIIRSETKQNISSQDLYLYPTFHVTDWLDFTAGGSYTNLELERREVLPFLDDKRGKNRWNPKLGATVYATPELTIRTAYFEGLRKSALEDVGDLEPTLVGGFNQTFTDFSGTESRNYGAGFDYKFSGSTYFGAEGLHRDTIEESTLTRTLVTLDFDTLAEDIDLSLLDQFDTHFNQEFVSAYLYHVFTSRVVGTIDYAWSMSETTDSDAFQEIELHKVALGLKYFDPSGWFTFSTATWRQQDRNGSFFFEDGNNNFWIIDAGLGYRIPDRHGSVVFKVTNLFDRDFTFDQSLGFDEFISTDVAAELLFSLNF
ncbi:MAG: FecR domain-containing protein [Deltaproteobacteria bacterium]|nr:FecR domain-containing protein [Deltaproteobacteria bacterium]